MLDNFLFVGLPYVALLLFVGGSTYRAFSGFKTQFRGHWSWGARGDFLWTTRSTGFFGRASLGPAVLTLHWGLITLLLGHLVGFIGGAAGWASWVDFFRWVGMVGGVLVLYGATWALARRLAVPQLRAMSTVEDLLILVFLILIAGLGLYHAAVRLMWGVSYGAGEWLVGLFTLRPNAAVMAGAPLAIKTHMVAAMLFFAWFPFTKLVHFFSFPFAYAPRPYISMRRYTALKR